MILPKSKAVRCW